MPDQRITFTVVGKPIPWHRARVSRSNRIDGLGVRHFKAKKDVAYQQAISMHAMHAVQLWTQSFKMPWDATGEWRVEMEFYVGDLRTKDLDNLQKQFNDAMSGIVFDDDNQVVSIAAKKVLDRERPRSIITIRRVEGYLTERERAPG